MVPPDASCASWPTPCPARWWSTRRTPTSPTRTAWRWSRENEKILVTRTLSKSYALAGLRFGYRRRPAAGDRAADKVKDSYNCDALSIAGATAAIDDQAWLDGNARGDPRHARAADRRPARARLRVRRLAGEFRLVPAPAACRSSRSTSSSRPSGILVRYMNYAGWGDGLRISVGTDEQIDACLSAA